MHLEVAVLLSAAPPPGNVFALDLQTLAVIGIQLFNACVLALVLTYVLYKPVRKFTQKRADRIQSQLDRAQSELVSATESKKQYEEMLREIEATRAEIIDTANKLAAQASGRMLAEAQREAEAIRERARQDTQREFARAQQGLERYIIDLSSTMAERVIEHSIDEKTQRMLFEETLREMEEAAWPH